jgi:hypothetical protein
MPAQLTLRMRSAAASSAEERLEVVMIGDAD